MVSNNGTNFVAGEKEIRQLVEAFEKDKIVYETLKPGLIEWKFNPPPAPHFGGIFEATIKNAKKALRTVIGVAEINDDELHTAMYVAEKLLNSRPITCRFRHQRLGSVNTKSFPGRQPGW